MWQRSWCCRLTDLLPLVLLICIGGSMAEARTKCDSQMPGDFRYEGCGAFCKPEKAQNHCKVCHRTLCRKICIHLRNIKCRATLVACSSADRMRAPMLQFCKCRSCAFCAKLKTPTAAAPTTLPAPEHSKIKKKKKPAEAESNSTPTPTTASAASVPTTAPAATASAPATATGKIPCWSGLKGDFNYRTCGAFCKPAKAANHCK